MSRPSNSSWRPQGERQLKCKYCGESGFHWMEVDSRWKLVDSNDELHVCDDYQPAQPQDNNKFVLDATNAGFTLEQASFLWEKFGKK